MSARALRVLCLHGFRGSATGMRAQMRGWLKKLGPAVEFSYLDAPLLATGQRAWWDAVPIAGAEPAKRYEGWQATRTNLEQYFELNGPIDGVLGFSQGATLSGLLVGLRAAGGAAAPQRPLQFRFAVLVSGFVSKDPQHAKLYAAREAYSLPSLHVIGRADDIVPSVASHSLADRFENPTRIEHGAGHVLSLSAQNLAAVAEFFACRQAEAQ